MIRDTLGESHHPRVCWPDVQLFEFGAGNLNEMNVPHHSDARRHFLKIAACAPESIDLAEAALWIAAENCPDLDVDLYRTRIDELAQRIRPRMEAAADGQARVETLNTFLFDECGFHGNREDYYDPRNSYLNEVLDRRIGIPISLAILWIAVARRLGLDAQGVSFPGHFLATIQPVLVDCFEGRIVTPEECRAMLMRQAGPQARFDLNMLVRTSPPAILARLLRNLKQIFARESQLLDALACSDRIVTLQPEMPEEVRDRGILYQGLECWSDARADLEQYLMLAPGAEDADEIRAIVAGLRDRKTQLH